MAAKDLVEVSNPTTSDPLGFADPHTVYHRPEQDYHLLEELLPILPTRKGVAHIQVPRCNNQDLRVRRAFVRQSRGLC